MIVPTLAQSVGTINQYDHPSINIPSITPLLDQPLNLFSTQYLIEHLIHTRCHPLQAAADINRGTVGQPFFQLVGGFAQSILHVDFLCLIPRECQVQTHQIAARQPFVQLVPAMEVMLDVAFTK